MFARPLLALPAAALLLAAADSHAFCLPTIHHINIGSSKAAGTGCDYVYAEIQTAITNACPNTVISIAGGVTLANVALEINGKSNLTLVGLAAGTTCIDPPPVCDPSVGCGSGGGTPPAPNVTLQGTGADSVIYIHGSSSVTLESLKLTGGHGPILNGGFGGGIHFAGTGSLTLIDSTITNNSATYGAGIQFNGSGGNATLTLGAGTIIEQNTATSDGGGIHINGSARLFALAPYTSVDSNSASQGYGGGIAVIGPARADIGSPGYNGAAISYNDAKSGGGIAVIDNGSGEAVLREFATAASQPTAIQSNAASSNGGGIFVTGQADACLFAPYIADNIAEDGAAVYYNLQVAGSASYAYDSGIYINGGSPSRLGEECGPEHVADLGGSKDCRPYDAQCSAFVSNKTQHANSTPAPGGVISAQGGDVTAARFRIRKSVAAYAVYMAGTTAVVSRCLITDNQVSTNLIYGFNGVRAEFHNCTIANNTIDGSVVFWFNYFPYKLDLANNIVDQPGKYVAAWDPQAGGLFNVGYILTNSVSGLPPGNPSIVQGLPTFVDAANGDYHLAPVAQVALDFGNTGAVDPDLDGGSATVDLLSFPNFILTADDLGGDLGAYERQNLFYNCGSNNSIFCDGFDH